MYNTSLISDYDAFTDSLEGGLYDCDNRTEKQIKKDSEEYAKNKKIKIEKALNAGEQIVKEEFNNGTINATHYELKIGKLTYVTLTTKEALSYIE